MWIKTCAVTLLGTWLASGAWAADDASPSGTKPLFVSPVAAAPGFSTAQIDFVRAWISRSVPECPPEVATAAAEQFLGELESNHPQELDLLLSAGFPTRDFKSALLRRVGAQLTGESLGTLRGTVAERRISALLAAEEPGTPAVPGAALLGKVRDLSDTQYRRLLEGRMDDDDLEVVLKKVRQPAGTRAGAEPAKPRQLTAQDIVAEFARRNLEGSAIHRLQAYVIEALLTTTTGEEQQLLLFKMRPDRFRLMMLKNGRTVYILGASGDRFWQQTPGRPAQVASAKSMGARRYMAEFIDPLFAEEGYAYERIADGQLAGKPTYRLTVKRDDGSKYVTVIDPETFREIAREDEDKSVSRYSDYRSVAGITLAFREEITDAQGRHGSLVLTRITPNAGLIEAFFEPPPAQAMDYFEIERVLASAPTKERP